MNFRIIILTIIYTTIATTIIAQDDSISISKNAIYVEGIGIGGFGSINYERKLFAKSNHQIQARIGISTLNTRDFTNTLNPDFIFPFAINWLYGNKHNIEIGVGQTLTNIVAANPSNGQPKRTTQFSANFNIGYRYQKSTGGFLFRCGYTPFIENYQNYRHWGGISFGYAFKVK